MNYEAFYAMSYGLYVVGASGKDQLHGYVANTAFQVTADPPRIAISCHKENGTRKAIEESGFFSLSVLHEEAGKELISVFGYKTEPGVDRFATFTHMIGANGAPILLEDCLAYFECRVDQVVDIGTHLLFIGLVENAVQLKVDREPMTYRFFRKTRKAVSPEHSPTYVDKHKLESNASSQSKCYVCLACGYLYDPEEGDPDSGIPPGTPFEDIPDDWICPVCGLSKGSFVEF